jgi:hypothetical protein
MGSSDNDWFGLTSDIVDKVLPDILVRNEGTIFLFIPLMPAAKDWIAKNVQPGVQWFGNALAVEWRFAAELAAAIRDAGLALS